MLSTLLLLLILMALGGYVGYMYYKKNILGTTTTTTRSPVGTGTSTTLVSIGNDNNVYAVVDDVEFVQNMYSYGNVNVTYQNCNSVIQCSNYLFNDPTSTGANYLTDTKTCELISAISPIGVNQTSNSVLILRTSSKLSNGLNLWSKNDTATSLGNLYCSPTLAYRDYARALCANIPYCKAFTYEIDSVGNPYGCLKSTNSTVANSATAVSNVSYYSGQRNDAVNLPSKYTYQYGMTVSPSTATPDVTQNQIDIATCAQLAQVKGAGSAVWTYSPNGGGSCQIYYQAVSNISPAANATFMS